MDDTNIDGTRLNVDNNDECQTLLINVKKADDPPYTYKTSHIYDGVYQLFRRTWLRIRTYYLQLSYLQISKV